MTCMSGESLACSVDIPPPRLMNVWAKSEQSCNDAYLASFVACHQAYPSSPAEFWELTGLPPPCIVPYPPIWEKDIEPGTPKRVKSGQSEFLFGSTLSYHNHSTSCIRHHAQISPKAAQVNTE